MSESISKIRKTRKFFPISQKLQIISDMKNGKSMKYLKKRYNVTRYNISSWLKNEKKLVKIIEKTKKTIHTGPSPKIKVDEFLLLKILNEKNKKNEKVDSLIILGIIKNSMRELVENVSQRQLLTWIYRFIKKYKKSLYFIEKRKKKSIASDLSFNSQNKTISTNNTNHNSENEILLIKNLNDLPYDCFDFNYFFLDEISFSVLLDDSSFLSSFDNQIKNYITIKILFLHDNQLKIILPLFLMANKNPDDRYNNLLKNFINEINNRNQIFLMNENNNTDFTINNFLHKENFYQFFPTKEQFKNIKSANNSEIEFISNIKKENFEKYLENKIVGKFLKEIFSSSTLLFDDEYCEDDHLQNKVYCFEIFKTYYMMKFNVYCLLNPFC